MSRPSGRYSRRTGDVCPSDGPAGTEVRERCFGRSFVYGSDFSTKFLKFGRPSFGLDTSLLISEPTGRRGLRSLRAGLTYPTRRNHLWPDPGTIYSVSTFVVWTYGRLRSSTVSRVLWTLVNRNYGTDSGGPYPLNTRSVYKNSPFYFIPVDLKELGVRRVLSPRPTVGVPGTQHRFWTSGTRTRSPPTPNPLRTRTTRQPRPTTALGRRVVGGLSVFTRGSLGFSLSEERTRKCTMNDSTNKFG